MTEKTAKKPFIASPSPASIGPYSIVRSIGRGGMGEVFLAHDPSCGRQLAVKRIRPDLSKNQTILHRFLREAKVASQLTHPSIIPILSIESNPPNVYYTMPYVEGDTLKQILKNTIEAERGQTAAGKSIPALARIFLQVCEAIAYTHSKGILHRDLKPENIIIGKYGEVMILDWGIADFIDEMIREKKSDGIDDMLDIEENLTCTGKITGTLAYMAPERVLGGSSTPAADIYSLGVMLYYMLTLQLPFQRKSIPAFRKMAKNERLVDPLEAAPYRDIPHQLAAVSKKCLSFSPSERYQNAEELIQEIKNYSEGRAEWISIASLNSKEPEDWQFQENILPAQQTAITRDLGETQWAALMISKMSFANSIKIEAELRMDSSSQGVGFLLSMPESAERRMLEEGYCIWISPQEYRLYRNNVQIYAVKNDFKWTEKHLLSIQKIEDVLKLYIDHTLIFTYASHLPLHGTHVGLLHKDSAFSISPLNISDASHNAYVRCLAVPNAFLSRRLFDLALIEYRRIGQSFPGRQEGRDALFRAGIALLEKGKAQKSKPLKEQTFHLALKEFGNLYHTSGAPLEYLGKSLVYDALGDSEEEAKCLELSLRKFPRHPLIPIVKEHILYRMHESSQVKREAAYRIILLSIRHIPSLLSNPASSSLIHALSRNLEPLPFFEPANDLIASISIQLAFWLAKPLILGEIARNLSKKENPDIPSIENALFCLLELEREEELEKLLKEISSAIPPESRSYFRAALAKTIPDFSFAITKKEMRIIAFLLKKALVKKDFDAASRILQALHQRSDSKNEQKMIDPLIIWMHLLQGDLAAAKRILQSYPKDLLSQENSPFHFVYGCYLYAASGKEKALNHFAKVLESPYPTTCALPSYFLTGRINGKRGWIERAFWWEKKELHRQIDFFYDVIGRKKK